MTEKRRKLKERREQQLTRAEYKQIQKEVIQEWLDEQWAKFGKWSAVGLASMAFAAITYYFLMSQGWSK